MAKAIAITKGLVDVTVTVQGFDPLVVPYNRLSAEIQRSAMVHGLAQKLGDAAAMSRNPANGQPATNADKYKAIKAVYDNIMAGRWNLTAGGVANHALTAERVTVLGKMFKLTDEQVTQWAKGRTEAQLAAAFTSAKFQLEMAKHRAATAATASDDVFEGLTVEAKK